MWLGNFHIYAFVLISGYIYCAKYKIEDKTDFLPFIKKKAKRLLVPYIFTALVWVVPITNFFLPFRQNDIFTRYILAENPSQLWFLIMLFDVFLFVRPLSDFFIKHTILGGGAALVFYILGIGGGIFFLIFLVYGMECSIFYFSFLDLNYAKRGAVNCREFRVLHGFWRILFFLLHGNGQRIKTA